MSRPAVISALGALLFAATIGAVEADPSERREPRQEARQDPASPFMRVFGSTQPPHGFVAFCERSPEECRQGPTEDVRFNMDRGRRGQLEAVNQQVNREIEPATDQEIYGVSEYWAIPVSRGDCEDYALLKRKLLMQSGWPASALLMTVVIDEKREGHAVLMARTLQGDFVLDNKTDVIKPWAKTPYAYVMRQSYLNPRVWMALDPKDIGTPQPLAGNRANR